MLGFILFCLLSSAGWLIPSASDGVPALERLGLLYGVVGVLFAARRWRVERLGLRWVWLALAGVGLFGVPIVFFEWAAGGVSGTGGSVAFAVVPVVVVMVVAFAGDDGGGEAVIGSGFGWVGWSVAASAV
jgi:hypothetical protein